MKIATQLGRMTVATVAIFALSTGLLPAATNTWDGGGGADYHWNTAANWDNDTLPANDGTAVIDATAAATVIIIDADRDIDELIVGGAGNLRFTAQNTTITIRSALRRLNTDQIEYDTPLAIGADGVVFENPYSGNNRFYSPITDNGNGYDWIIDGTMDFRDNGTLDQPSDFSGQVVMLSGTVFLRADHAFTNAASWHVSNSAIWPNDAGDKLGDGAPMTFYNGAFYSFGAAVEDVGPLALASGICTLRPSGAGAIQADSLTRGGTPGTRALCRIMNVSVANYVKFDSTAGMGLVGGDGSRTTNKKIVPYMCDYAALNNQFRTLVTYDATAGLSELATSDFVTNTTANFPAVDDDGNDNVRLSFTDAGSDTITLTGNTSVNALLVYADDANASHYLDLGGFTLTIKSGVFIANNDLGGNNDSLYVQNGTIDTGAAEMIVLSTMGAANNGLQFSSTCNITGTDGVTVYNAYDPVNFNGLGANLTTLTLIDCKDLRMEQGSIATNAIIVGSLLNFSTGNNIVRPHQFGASLVFAEAHGTLFLKPGHSTLRGDEGIVIGGSSTDHVKNHIRLLGNGVLSPHSTSISDPDQTELDGGVIGLSAYDFSNDNHPTDAFTVDLHGGQVIIDIFDADNYDQVRVISSEFGDENLSLDAGGGTGSELVVRLHAVPDNADTFTIVQVDDTTAITGTFSNGNTVSADYEGKAYVFDIDYTGDTGNDIVLSNARLLPKGTVVSIK
jgi:hypothetical protein